MAQTKHLQKNYCSSSALSTYKEFNLGSENLPKELCLASEKQNNIKISLEQFMENQEKKHLSTKFNKREVESFLKDKDAAMEEINIDENIINKDLNNENNNVNKNSIIINKAQNDNKYSHILIFKGTFGNEQFNKILNEEHHHHQHHHHHHHHHHRQHHNNNNHENN